MQWTEFRSHIRHLSSLDQERVQKAFTMGEKAHSGQKRKSGEPYFTHPVAVADMLADMGADADTIIAALLHDTLEDTTMTMETIEKEFGPTVTALIDGVTKLSRADMGEKPTLDEQTETLRKIFTLMQEDIRIMVVKLIDRLHNMQTVEFLPPERQRLLAQETQDIYVKIADRLCMQDLRDDLQELCMKVLEPELFVHLAQLRTDSERRGQKIIKKMEAELAGQDALSDVSMAYDEQSWNAYRKKFEVEGGVATGIAAISIVFVCPDRDVCYRVLGLLHERWRRETLWFQDFINSPQINGYQGLHTTVILSDGSRVRCKIRTHDMQRYADNGIATICFGSSPKGIMDELPCARRIAALSEDTKDRSREFWESLQSDILGESIVIHGPSDESVHLPAGSTALDGAFFLFHETALRTASIKVNGLEVPFQTTLKHGDAVNVMLSREPAVVREWLTWTNTGLATANIRAALTSTQSNEDKLIVGKIMLQRVFTERRKGLIEEFHETMIVQGLHRIGKKTLEEAYLDIADGHLLPSEVYSAIFEPEDAPPIKPQTRIVQYRTDMGNINTMDRVNAVHRKHGQHLMEIRYQRASGSTSGTVLIRCRMTQQERDIFLDELITAGAEDISIQSSFARVQHITMVTALILLWGLDPVIAHSMLAASFEPFILTFLRFATVFFASIIGYGFHTVTAPHRLKPLSPLQPSLLLAGIALFITGILTYQTLTLLPATQYILFILLGQIIMSTVKQWKGGTLTAFSVVSIILVGAGLALLLSIQHASLSGILFGIATSFSFALYSEVSEQYQQNMISIRYPAYLLWVSLVAVVCAFLLLPFMPFTAPARDALLIGIGFSLLFTFVPYILYFESTRSLGRAALDRLLPLTCIATFAGEIILQQTFSPALVLVLFLVTVALSPVVTGSRPAAKA